MQIKALTYVSLGGEKMVDQYISGQEILKRARAQAKAKKKMPQEKGISFKDQKVMKKPAKSVAKAPKLVDRKQQAK